MAAQKIRIAVPLPAGPKITDPLERILWAEDNAITDGWFFDAGAPDSLTPVAAVAHYTQTMRIGVTVIPAYSRTPAVLAATADALSQLLPGRFAIRLGASSPTIIVGGWHALTPGQSMPRIPEHIRIGTERDGRLARK